MAAQHAKWLKVCNGLPWRQPIASLNLILASNVWQQDHNGFTHQDPGFLDHIANKKADVVRLYLDVYKRQPLGKTIFWSGTDRNREEVGVGDDKRFP